MEREMDRQIGVAVLICNIADVVPDCCGEEGVEPEDKALGFPVQEGRNGWMAKNVVCKVTATLTFYD